MQRATIFCFACMIASSALAGCGTAPPNTTARDSGAADAPISEPDAGVASDAEAGTEAAAPEAAAPDGAIPDDYAVAAITVLTETGGRVDWAPSGDRIAYDAPDANGVFGVYTMAPDGTDSICVSCSVDGLPGRNVGNPAWDPSGNYLVVIAEKAVHGGTAFATDPGRGLHSDLYLIDVAAKKAFPLTNLPDGPNTGVLHPHFSHDGKFLSWSQMTDGSNPLQPQKAAGYWTLETASIEIGPDGASLSDVKTFAPGGDAFYENHGFSSSGERLIFTSNYQDPLWSADVYALALATGTATALTDQGYNEHAIIAPSDQVILFMTNLNVQTGKGTEWWLMNADGSDKRQLTHFNEPGNPQAQPGTSVCADSSWRPDGRAFVGLVLDGPLSTSPGKILRVDFAQ
jgi:hypothetical protein